MNGGSLSVLILQRELSTSVDGNDVILWTDPQTLKELMMFTNSTAVCFLNSKYKNPIIPNSSTQSTSGVLLLPPGYNKSVCNFYQQIEFSVTVMDDAFRLRRVPVFCFYRIHSVNLQSLRSISWCCFFSCRQR